MNRAVEGRKSYAGVARFAAVWEFGGRISSRVVLMVFSLFLARLLSPADFGIVAASRFFQTLASRVTQLGLNASLVRMKNVEPEHASSVFVANLVFGVVAFAALWAASPALGRYFNSADVARVIPIASLSFLISPFGTVAGATLDREMRYRSTTTVQWIDGVGGGAIALILAFAGFGFWSLVIGALAGTVLSTGLKLRLSPWRPSLRVTRKGLADTLSFGVGIQARRIVSFAATNLDNLIVARLLGVTALGYYDKAFGLMQQVTDRMTLDGTLFRIFAVIHEDVPRFRSAVVRGIQATCMMMFPILAVAAVSADRLIPVMFGAQWAPAVVPFRILAVVGLLRAGTRAVFAANEALGLVWYQFWATVAGIAALVALVAAGAYWWGLYGAAIGVLVASCIGVAVNLHILRRFGGLTLGDLGQAYLPPLFSTAALVVAVHAANVALLRMFPAANDYVQLAVDVPVAATVFLLSTVYSPFAVTRELVRESLGDLLAGLRRFAGWSKA